MRLISLRLENFMGCRSFDFEPGGADASVFGDNGAGKSTLNSAYTWILFGKDSLGQADFDIKTLGPDNEPLHGLEHGGEAVFELQGGERITFRRIYKEDWVKNRGASDKTFEGHSTDFWINSVPIERKRDYEARVAHICSEKTFRLLSDPLYFNVHLKWEERRRMLIEICGGVSDADVIASSSQLSKLTAILGSHSIDEYKKMAAGDRKKANEEREDLPVKISEVDRMMSALSSEVKYSQEARDAAAAKLSTLQEKRATILAGGEIAEKTKLLRIAESDLQGIATKIRSAGAAEREAAEARVREKDREIADAQTSLRIVEGTIRSHQSEVASIAPRLARLVADFRAENAKVFEAVDSCPTCKQSLPVEQIDAAREEFNLAKAERLEANKAEGVPLRKRETTLLASIKEAEAEAGEIRTRIAALEAERDDLRSALPGSAVAQPGDALEGELDAKKTEIAALEVEIASLREGASSGVADVDREIAEVESGIQALDQAKASAGQKEQLTARIDQLKDRERELAAEIEKLDGHLYLIEEFIRTKVRMLTDRINERFTLARFKLFEEQINEGLRECCEVMVGGVPYGSLNHGSRINVGLEILNVIAEHQGFAPPVWVDNAESVTALLPTRGQQIRLVVSAEDRALRVVYGSSSAEATADGAPVNAPGSKPAQEELLV